MPLESLHKQERSAWALWKIEEEEPVLAAHIAPFERVPDSISNPFKRLEFLAGRALVRSLVESLDAPFEGIVKDPFGKPLLRGLKLKVSLSHSYPYVGAIVDADREVGIDVEQPKSKLLRVAPRVLSPGEQRDAGGDLTKHCIYWCAKESLIKIYGKKDLVLSENLRIEPFLREKSGLLVGSIIVNNKATTVPLRYHVYDNFVVVVNA